MRFNTIVICLFILRGSKFIATYNEENYFDMALGLADGRKWINRKGFTLETLFGVGRNLFFDEESDSGDRSAASARLNISIGKRF